ncbi:PLG [Mytilus edulis]|uniref:PLG n=1 Tax=Mytilus edulis TaxID=6550 RepID=A0A8S3R8R9_MYTED|nr:PLG [Mytilus edulis]
MFTVKLLGLFLIFEGNILNTHASKIDVDCYNKDNNGSTYIGTVNIASNNQTCLNWRTVSSPYVTYDEKNAFCRNPNGFKKPWCYTGAGFQFSYCNISVCDVDCYNTNDNGSSYVGTVHTSRLNHPCLNWLTVNSLLVPYHENHTYCRNPNGFGEPWCYTGTLNNGFENCDVQMCDIDDCASNPCQHNSTCIDLVGGYMCSCGPGLTGVHCENGNEIVIPPSIILSAERSIQEGIGRFVLPCFAEGIPLPKVKWESIEVTNHQVHVTPRITAPFEVEVNYYANAKLVCNVTGYPTPRIQWKFANKTLPSTSSTLTLLRATNETAGIYTCIATNDVGTSKADIKLKVTFDTPKIVSPPLTTVCKAGASHNFTCIATGNPSPEISWSFTSVS